MNKIVHKDGEYLLVEYCRETGAEKEVLWRGEEIAIAFDMGEMWTLHKVGCPQKVQEWLDHAVASYRAAGLADLASSLAMLSSSSWDADDLNWARDCTGSLPRILAKYGVAEQVAGRWVLKA